MTQAIVEVLGEWGEQFGAEHGSSERRLRHTVQDALARSRCCGRQRSPVVARRLRERRAFVRIPELATIIANGQEDAAPTPAATSPQWTPMPKPARRRLACWLSPPASSPSGWSTQTRPFPDDIVKAFQAIGEAFARNSAGATYRCQQLVGTITPTSVIPRRRDQWALILTSAEASH